MDELVKILDEHELLAEVIPLVDPDLPDVLASLELRFRNTTVFISVNPDDDSVQVASNPPADVESRSPISNRMPWSSAVNRPMIWAWRLTNQQGYEDGIQLAFMEEGSGKECVVIQLLGKASALEIATLQHERHVVVSENSSEPNQATSRQ